MFVLYRVLCFGKVLFQLILPFLFTDSTPLLIPQYECTGEAIRPLRTARMNISLRIHKPQYPPILMKTNQSHFFKKPSLHLFKNLVYSGSNLVVLN